MTGKTVLTIHSPSIRTIETQKMARTPLSAEMLLRLAEPLKDVRRSLLLLDDALGVLEVDVEDGKVS